MAGGGGSVLRRPHRVQLCYFLSLSLFPSFHPPFPFSPSLPHSFPPLPSVHIFPFLPSSFLVLVNPKHLPAEVTLSFEMKQGIFTLRIT